MNIDKFHRLLSEYWQQPGDGVGSDNDDDDTNEATAAADGTTLVTFGRSGIIYLIDADPSLTANAEHFTNCLEIIEENMLNRIIQSGRDLVAIVLYNTEHSPAPATVATTSSATAGGCDGSGGGRSQFDDTTIPLVVPANTAIVWPMQQISRAAISYVKEWRQNPDKMTVSVKPFFFIDRIKSIVRNSFF